MAGFRFTVSDWLAYPCGHQNDTALTMRSAIQIGRGGDILVFSENI